MRTLFSGELTVSYAQFYIDSRVDIGRTVLEDSFAGQRNGLCGAALPGLLFLNTGLRTGAVGLTIELHDEEPSIKDEWEDIVEASFAPLSSRTRLVEWGDSASWSLELMPIGYRVRFCARGMDEGRERGTRVGGEPGWDSYLLQFWSDPEGEKRDVVLRATSEVATRWHQNIQRFAATPRVHDDEASSVRPSRSDEQRVRRAWDAVKWGGQLPSSRLRNTKGNVGGMLDLDRNFTEAVAAADSYTQRKIALWAARRALTHASLINVDWIAAAFEALEAGRDLPPPFDSQENAWRRMLEDRDIPQIVASSQDKRIPRITQQSAALPVLWAASESDPLQAALDSLYAAAIVYRDDYTNVFRDVHENFLTHG